MQTKELTDKVARCQLKASIVFREIVSYIKGSAQALDSPGGHLSRSDYLLLGRKVLHYLLPTTTTQSGALPTTYYPLLLTHHYYSLRTTHYPLLLITNYPLRTTTH